MPSVVIREDVGSNPITYPCDLNKRIDKPELKSYLNRGWIKGRKTDYYGAIA